MSRLILSVAVVLAVGLSMAVAQEAGKAPAASSKPYKDQAASIPGKIQVENFDQGGEGVAFHDNEAENTGKAYRKDGPDITKGKDPKDEGGFELVKTMNDEWVVYTVNAKEGTYDLMLRGCGLENRKVTIALDGQEIVTAPLPAGSWGNYNTVLVKGVKVPGGEGKKLKLTFAGNYSTNLNYLEFVEAGKGVEEAPDPSKAPVPAPKGEAKAKAKGKAKAAPKPAPAEGGE